jgi:hypothetical protein
MKSQHSVTKLKYLGMSVANKNRIYGADQMVRIFTTTRLRILCLSICCLYLLLCMSVKLGLSS